MPPFGSTATAGLRLGAPGVYFVPPAPQPVPDPIHLHETGFVGITGRGPVQTPVRVTSWSEYARLFGGLPDTAAGDPPALLAHAVDAYFGQGGAVAWVLRVVPPDRPGRAAEYGAPGCPLVLAAANEGTWGNRLAVRLSFAAAPPLRLTTVPGPAGTVGLRAPAGTALPPHSLLRLRWPGVDGPGSLGWLSATAGEWFFDGAAPPPGTQVDAAVVTGTLTVTDLDPAGGATERFTGLGLHPAHDRYLGEVLADGSALVRAAAPVTVAPADGYLRPVTLTPTAAGTNSWADIGYDAFFDAAEPPEQDPTDDDENHRGVDRMGRVTGIGLLCVPDLLWAWRPDPGQTVTAPARPPAGRFGPCHRPATADLQLPASATPPSQLTVDDLDAILDRQRRVVAVAELRARFVALLDVPRGLPVRDIARWRTEFDSAYAAAYHPWLAMPARVGARTTVFVPPSAFAAGIAAAGEIAFGVQRGPANAIAARAVSASAVPSDPDAGALFTGAINLFRPERDGYRLISARTLSTDPQYLQLSVRRLMTTVELTLRRLGEDLVFEPGTPALRDRVVQAVTGLLRGFHRAGALAGATEAEAFFVDCGDTLNDDRTRARGQLIAEIGVAPAAPLEFIVVRLVQGIDGTAVVSSDG